MGHRPVFWSDRVVSSRRLTLTHGRFADGDLIVTCWCEGRLVRVAEADVLAGKTESCGRRRCVPDLEAAR